MTAEDTQDPSKDLPLGYAPQNPPQAEAAVVTDGQNAKGGETVDEKVKDAIASLSPDVQHTVDQMVRMDPTIGMSLIAQQGNEKAIETAVRAGWAAAAGGQEAKEQLVGVDPQFAKVAEGAYELAKNQQMETDAAQKKQQEEQQQQTAEIVDAAMEGIVATATPRHAMPPKQVPPFPQRKNS